MNVELETVLRLARAHRAVLVNLGHGRDGASLARAELFAEAWLKAGGELGSVVSWPAVAASWLRPACRLASGAPDVWVIADEPAGWAGFGRRLAADGRWRARRTVCFAGLGDPVLPKLAGRPATEGLSGTTATGEPWTFTDAQLERAWMR
ncbi:hypothetical protein [Amycolatopsis nigrescens]|uniref:hypothetical protein n=1 Tax=Amycolatopsis nigrescens TaxID=381445 RepID=UPI00039D6EA9|nr:hypothetical protein [Amycolatopsis nigrescens]